MKLFSRLIIVYIFTVAQLSPAFARTNLVGEYVSPHDIFEHSVDKNRLYLDANRTKPNDIRLMGLNHDASAINEGLKNALRTQQSLVLINPEGLTSNTRYLSLLETHAGQRELFRMYDEAFRNISVTSERNFSADTKELRRSLNTQVVEEFSRDTRLKALQAQEFNSRATLEVNRRLLIHTSAEERQAAEESRKNVVERNNTASKRAANMYREGLAAGRVPGKLSIFNPRTKIAAARGYYTLYVKGPSGREIPTFHPVSGEAMKTVDAPGKMIQLRNGAIELTLFSAVFMGFMALATGYNMVADFESNPNAFADSFDMAPIMATSSMGFLLGGAGTSLAAERLGFSANPREVALRNIEHAVKNGEAYKSPGLRQRVLQSSIATYKTTLITRATSYWGLSGGLIASQIVAKWAHSLRSCSRLLEVDYGQYPEHERQQMEASCQKTYLGMIGEVASDPLVWKDVLSILSTKALFMFGISPAMAALHSMSKDVRAPEAVNRLRTSANNVPHRLKVIVRFGGKVGSTLLSPTVVGFVAFYVAFEFISHKLELLLDQLKYNVPANRAAENIRVLMDEYRQSGWKMEELCKNRNFIDGGFWGSLRSLWYWDKGEQCSQELLTSFINFHANSNKAWREKIKKPVNDSIDAWSYYTFQAVNMYKASKMFYKDIVEQVRLKKLSGEAVDFNSSRDGQSIKSALQADYYSETLPLFRSDIFFGWSYRIDQEDGDALDYPIANGKVVSWEERVKSDVSKNMLIDRLARFSTQVLPVVIEELEKAPESRVAEASPIERMLKGIRNPRDLAFGLNELTRVTEEENRDALNRCTGKLFRNSDWSRFEEDCFFTILNSKFLDNDFWIKKESGEFIFNKSENNPFRAGYKTGYAEPFGVKPLHMGQRFFIDYNRRFGNNGIDHLLFAEDTAGLTDSLLKGMICGVDVTSGELMYKQTWLFGKHIQPEFMPPKLLLKGEVNPCGRTEHQDGKFWDYGWNPYFGGFYSYIRDTEDENKSYNGIVEFLYNEIDESVLNDFEGWWGEHVQPQFENVIDNIYRKYYTEEVIAQRFSDALGSDNTDTNCYEACSDFEFEHKESIAATIKQEVDTYLTYFVEPILNDLPVDVKRSDVKDLEEAKTKLVADYTELKNEIYAIFDFMTGRSESLVGFEKLNTDFQIMMEEASAQMDFHQNGSSQNYDLVKLRALKTIMYDRFYNLKVLFKTDNGAMLVDIFNASMEYIVGLEYSSAEAFATAVEEARQEYLTMAERFDSMAEREGKVLLNYPDWVGSAESPTMQVVRTAHNISMRLFDELIALEELKQTLKPINQY